jgi:N-glycosylase/DNA lyase
MSVIPTGPIAIRPPFPSGWAYLNLGIDDCDLANILPVGQSFLWHRHQLQITTTELTKVEAVESEIAYTSGSTAGPSDDEAAPADIIEEFSRAIDNPPRVILLRQSVARRRVYYTSVAPTDIARSTGNPTAYEREEVDEKWMNDYFQLERVIDLPALYASWIRGDTDLFARTLGDEEADRLNGLYFGHGSRSERVEHMAGRGIRVLSQDPWECLIAYVHTLVHGDTSNV